MNNEQFFALPRHVQDAFNALSRVLIAIMNMGPAIGSMLLSQWTAKHAPNEAAATKFAERLNEAQKAVETNGDDESAVEFLLDKCEEAVLEMYGLQMPPKGESSAGHIIH